MQAAERETRQDRWLAWHIAALPMLKRFPSASSFIDPAAARPTPQTKAARTFWALRNFDDKPAPDWVIAKFRELEKGGD